MPLWPFLICLHRQHGHVLLRVQATARLDRLLGLSIDDVNYLAHQLRQFLDEVDVR